MSETYQINKENEYDFKDEKDRCPHCYVTLVHHSENIFTCPKCHYICYLNNNEKHHILNSPWKNKELYTCAECKKSIIGQICDFCGFDNANDVVSKSGCNESQEIFNQISDELDNTNREPLKEYKKIDDIIFPVQQKLKSVMDEVKILDTIKKKKEKLESKKNELNSIDSDASLALVIIMCLMWIIIYGSVIFGFF